MVDAHLKTELYYVFNTKWGTGKERDHRIVYDFLSKLDKSAQWTPQQREHFTILTVLSLAAQEYFWNEKSTIVDLQDRVRRELRYGSLKETGHVLNISNAVCLDDAYLERIIDGWVNTNLNAKLKALMDGFKGKGLGITYTEIVVDLDTKFGGRKESLPFDDFRVADFSVYGLDGQMDLNPVLSDGDGMCGEHSLFIPTDGACGGISDGNGRYKILRAILDNPTDRVARRLYLLNSEHMIESRFVAMIDKYIGELGTTDATGAGDLKKKLDDYLEFRTRLMTEIQEKRSALARAMLNDVMNLSGLSVILTRFQESLNAPESIATWLKYNDFKKIIDEIILIGMNIDTGGHAVIKERFIGIKNEWDSLKQEIAAKKKELESAGKLAKEEAKANLDRASAELEDLKTRHKVLSASEGADKSEIDNLLTNITEKEKEASVKKKIHADTEKEYASKLDVFVAETCQSNSGILNSLTDLVDPRILLGKEEAFSIPNLCEYGYANFVNDICQEICAFVGENLAAERIRRIWDDRENEDIQHQQTMGNQLDIKRLAIAESLSFLPKEFAPGALAKEMEKKANHPEEELRGWLRCDATYTQLWAIINNLNVFVFSDKEYSPTFQTIVRPQFGLITRTKDAYESVTKVYDAKTTGKHLATVILTSPTAKNVFLDKSPNHYNKFIVPGDYVAMAKAQRHLEWKNLDKNSKNEPEKAPYKYSRYPLPTQG